MTSSIQGGSSLPPRHVHADLATAKPFLGKLKPGFQSCAKKLSQQLVSAAHLLAAGFNQIQIGTLVGQLLLQSRKIVDPNKRTRISSNNALHARCPGKWNDHLTGEVSTKYQGIHMICLCSVEELSVASLRTVKVGAEQNSHRSAPRKLITETDQPKASE